MTGQRSPTPCTAWWPCAHSARCPERHCDQAVAVLMHLNWPHTIPGQPLDPTRLLGAPRVLGARCQLDDLHKLSSSPSLLGLNTEPAMWVSAVAHSSETGQGLAVPGALIPRWGWGDEAVAVLDLRAAGMAATVLWIPEYLCNF